MAVDIHWLGHDSFRLDGEKTVYIDPWRIQGGPQADVILITHDHSDHCSPDDVAKVRSAGTVVVAPSVAAEKLGNVPNLQIMRSGQAAEIAGLAIEAVPAYNLDKFREPGKPYHPKEAGYLGYVISIGGERIYHAGDTDATPELRQVRCTIALLPVSGKYVMTAEEAAGAADALAPRLAIPMHYGTIVGSEDDARRFQSLTNVPVEILPKVR